MPGRGVNMGDGWETKRNRQPNNVDWVKIKLATEGMIKKIIVDTAHFKGNYPDRCSIEACNSKNDEDVINNKVIWQTILSEKKLNADFIHAFESESTELPFTHVRLNIFPDGGISRLRLLGNKKKHK